MEHVVVIYLWLSILLYFLLGGADFGAGIIELFTSRKNRGKTRRTLYHAIGPVWEANHMWLIIAIVILFVGFPVIYSVMSTYLHIPLLVLLLGIIARGTAFVFRHYDAVKDDMQRVYNRIFILSSFIAPLFLGIIAGSAVSGHIDNNAVNFLDAYVWGWLNWFSISVGLFTVSLCGFLAAVYLIGEAEDEEDKRRFILKAKRMNIAAVICGTLVFIASAVDHVPLAAWIFTDRIGLAAVVAASLSLAVLWFNIYKTKPALLRVLAGFQVTMILFAIGNAHFPYFIILKHGEHLSLLNHQGPSKSVSALGWALVWGSVFILPALCYLFYSFQKKVMTEHS